MLFAALALAVLGLICLVLVSHLVGIVILVVAGCFLLVALLGDRVGWP